MKKLLFFCFASAILIFSIIVVNISPFIAKYYQDNTPSTTDSCKYYSDYIDYRENQGDSDKDLEPHKKQRDRCNRRHAMKGLEYTSLIVDLVIGFICALLGFINYMNIGNVGKIGGLIGLGGGVVGFVLTFVYVIESGLVFDDIDGTNELRLNSDGAIYEWDSDKGGYTCIYYDEDNDDSVLLRYSDYGNKYLNYKKDIRFITEEKNYEYYDYVGGTSGGCNLGHTTSSPTFLQNCKNYKAGTPKYEPQIAYYDDSNQKLGDCKYLYAVSIDISAPIDNGNKILFDKWLTTLIFCCFIFLFDIGLAIFGFLLFRETNGSSGAVSIK